MLLFKLLCNFWNHILLVPHLQTRAGISVPLQESLLGYSTDIAQEQGQLAWQQKALQWGGGGGKKIE